MEAKVLIIGLGSIGKRHAHALYSINIDQIAALRSGMDIGMTKKGIEEKIIHFYDEKKAMEWNPTHLIISNPTHLHLQVLEKYSSQGFQIFVEKPVVDSYSLLNEKQLKELKGIKGQVGFNLRFQGVFRKLKKLLQNRVIGQILYSHIEVGHYLPFWHPDKDYRTRYSARKEMGGGVLRTLSHELDIAKYLFGAFTSLFAKIDTLSSLEINVDDCVDIIAHNERCKRTCIHLDYLNPQLSRKGEIIGENGSITYNFIEGRISIEWYEDKSQKEIIIDEDYQEQYIRQMEEFISNKNCISCSIKEGLEIDRIISLCEKSNKLNEVICLN